MPPFRLPSQVVREEAAELGDRRRRLGQRNGSEVVRVSRHRR